MEEIIRQINCNLLWGGLKKQNQKPKKVDKKKMKTNIKALDRGGRWEGGVDFDIILNQKEAWWRYKIDEMLIQFPFFHLKYFIYLLNFGTLEIQLDRMKLFGSKWLALYSIKRS